MVPKVPGAQLSLSRGLGIQAQEMARCAVGRANDTDSNGAALGSSARSLLERADRHHKRSYVALGRSCPRLAAGAGSQHSPGPWLQAGPPA